MLQTNATQSTIISSVSRFQLEDKEVLLWSDGSVTVENWEHQFSTDDRLDHLTLTHDEAHSLYAILHKLFAQ